MRLLLIAFLFCGLGVLAQDTPPLDTPPQNPEKPAETEVSTDSLPDYDSFDNAVNTNNPDQLDGPIQPQKSEESLDVGGMYIQMFGSLLLVLGLMLGLAYVAKRFLPKQMVGATRGDDLKLIQSLPLGPKSYVSLIEADGQRILVGVTEENINLIKALDNKNFEQAMLEVEEPKRVRDWEAEP